MISLSVCLSFCLRAYLRNHWTNLHEIFCADIPCGRGSVLLWRRCDTLCTSGFMDDVTFGCSGPYGDAWLGIPERSLMSMTALLCFYRATACNATHGIAVGILSVHLSVCLSVRPSVRCVYCEKTKQRAANILIPHETAITLVF